MPCLYKVQIPEQQKQHTQEQAMQLATLLALWHECSVKKKSILKWPNSFETLILWHFLLNLLFWISASHVILANKASFEELVHVQAQTDAQYFDMVSGLNDMFPGNGVQRGLRYVFSCLVGVSKMSA